MSKIPFKPILLGLGLTAAGVYAARYLDSSVKDPKLDWGARIAAAVFGIYVPLAQKITDWIMPQRAKTNVASATAPGANRTTGSLTNPNTLV